MISRHSSKDMSRNEVWRRRPGIAHQDVDAAEPGGGFGGEPRRHGGIGHVAHRRHGLAARRLDLAHDAVDGRLVGAAVHDDGRAVARQRERNRAADILARARYERDLALQRL